MPESLSADGVPPLGRYPSTELRDNHISEILLIEPIMRLGMIIAVTTIIGFTVAYTTDARTTAMSESLQSEPAKVKEGVIPKDGFVPTADVAIAIAVAIWEPIYGKDHIAKKKPYHADLKDGVWTVEGSLPKGTAGGVPTAKISRADGRILFVIHSR
jgi:hypothetical protein